MGWEAETPAINTNAACGTAIPSIAISIFLVIALQLLLTLFTDHGLVRQPERTASAIGRGQDCTSKLTLVPRPPGKLARSVKRFRPPSHPLWVG